VVLRAKRPQKGKTRPAGRPRDRSTVRSSWVLLGAVVMSAVILVAWFPASSLYHQRASLASATTQLHTLRQQDTALAQEKENLSSSAEISRIARSQYQLVSPGQQAYEVLPPSGAAQSGTPYAGDPGSGGPVAPSAVSELPPSGASTTSVPPKSARNVAPQQSAPAEGTFERILHTLEFWR
jgi:cell division protein FtsB